MKKILAMLLVLVFGASFAIAERPKSPEKKGCPKTAKVEREGRPARPSPEAREKFAAQFKERINKFKTEMFKKLDTDKDGKLTLEEFLATPKRPVRKPEVKPEGKHPHRRHHGRPQRGPRGPHRREKPDKK